MSPSAPLRKPRLPSRPRTVPPLATADSPAACGLTSQALVLRAVLAAVAASVVAVEVPVEAVVVAVVAAVVSAAVAAAAAATSVLSTAPSLLAPRSPSTKKALSEMGLIYMAGCGYLRFRLQSMFGFLRFSGLWATLFGNRAQMNAGGFGTW